MDRYELDTLVNKYNIGGNIVDKIFLADFDRNYNWGDS